jgi:hypothetical protein
MPPRRFAHTVTYGMSPLCEGKAAYDTKEEVQAAIQRRRKHERAKLWWYKCQHPECPYYHMTRKRPPAEWCK